ncbi:MAG: bacterial Ig-like domain-containing protein, partial [Oscillospiraceae bacterium]
MTTKRKTQLKRAALSWLCVAALAGGSVPAGLPGIIPAVTAAAEDTQTIVSTINLGNLVEYVTNPQNCPTGITASYGKNKKGDTYNSIIELKITQSGTYKLTGSNLINDAYFDVKIIAAEGIGNVNIVCENAFIRNDEGSYEYLCVYNADSDKYCYDCHSRGDIATAANFVVPFKAEKDAAITLSGTLAVDTYSIYKAWNYDTDGNIYSYATPVSDGSGTVNTNAFSVVTYTDNNGDVIDRGYYLSAGENNPYSANLADIWITSSTNNGSQCGEIKKKPLSEMYVCFSTDGSRFNTASITGDVTVECSETHTDIDEDYTCDNCGDYFIIDLNKLGDYANGNTALPVNITAESSDNSITLTITHSGKYKLKGANTTDVKIYAAYGVTADIVCDDAYIKNTNGSYSIIEYGGDEYGPSLSLEASGYICPFGTNYDAKINLSGKLVVDTYSVFDITWNDDYPIGDFIAKVAEGISTVTGVFTPIDSYTNGKKDQAFYLNGAVYDASDYAGDHLCISVRGNDVGDYTFTAGTDNISFISYNDDHRFDNDSDVCKDCGVQFVRYNVTFNDGSETPKTERVINGRTVARPSDPTTAPVGKKFAGWYADEECTDKYDFDLPVTEDITLYAGWEALPVQSIAVKTAPKKTSYIEGEKFDPTGLVINAVYENGTLEVAYTDETKSDFTFSPTLTDKLAVTDEKVTITYGDMTAPQAITVAEKSLTSIAVKTAPKKTSYIEGESFDPTGLVVTLTYDNGETEDVAYSDSTKDGFTFSPEVLSLNNTKVTITYGGKSIEQAVTVTNKSLSSIAVKTAPKKTNYIAGEKFDPTGLV